MKHNTKYINKYGIKKCDICICLYNLYMKFVSYIKTESATNFTFCKSKLG